jgi:hypothetical protein
MERTPASSCIKEQRGQATRTEVAALGSKRKSRQPKPYPLSLPLQYSLIAPQSNGREQIKLTGRTFNLSDRTVIFASDQKLSRGSIVKLWINWPVCDQFSKLIITGRVVRSTRSETSAAILSVRYPSIKKK